MTSTQKNTEKMAALGRMTRGLVHDFNNSLASIMGYAEFLAADLDPASEQHLFASNIRKAGLQMQDLIDQIRAMAQEKGQGKDIALNLVEDIKNIVTRFQADAPAYHTLTVSSNVAEAIIHLPAHQVRTLFSNLIRNALEALPPAQAAHVHIHMSRANTGADTGIDAATPHQYVTTPLTVEQTPSPLFKITITDTGCGMDDVILNLAMEPHFTTKPTGDAHGMGLPIVYGIVNYLEGGLRIATTPEKGTEITILLPVEKIGDVAVSEASAPKTILLVEDRDMVRHTIATMLTREGHTVNSIGDGLSALDLLREQPDAYDVLITDLNMPHISGKDVIAEVRADFPELPIFILSGDSGDLRSIQNDVAQRNIKILPKPLSVEALRLALKNISGHSG